MDLTERLIENRTFRLETNRSHDFDEPLYIETCEICGRIFDSFTEEESTICEFCNLNH